MRLIIPDDARYSCFACGRCCRTSLVSLTAEEGERLKGFPSPFAEGPTVQAYVSERGEGRRIRPRRDGSCPYLREDSLCHIHAERGFDAKPIACRLFPAAFVRMPGGTAVSLKPSCPAVAIGAGELLSAQEPALRLRAEEVARVIEMDRAENVVLFDRRRTLPLADLETLHGHLLALLRRPRLGFLSQLAGAMEFLSLAETSSISAPSRYRYWQGLEDGIPGRFSGSWVPPAPPAGLDRPLYRQTAFGLASISSPAALRAGPFRRLAERAGTAVRGLAYSAGVSRLSSAFVRGIPVKPYLDRVLSKACAAGSAPEAPHEPFHRFLTGSLAGHAYYTGRFTPRTVRDGLLALFRLVPFGIWFARADAGEAAPSIEHAAMAVVRLGDAAATPSAGARLSRGLSGWVFRRPDAWFKLLAWSTGTPDGEPIRLYNEPGGNNGGLNSGHPVGRSSS